MELGSATVVLLHTLLFSACLSAKWTRIGACIFDVIGRCDQWEVPALDVEMSKHWISLVDWLSSSTDCKLGVFKSMIQDRCKLGR